MSRVGDRLEASGLGINTGKKNFFSFSSVPLAKIGEKKISALLV